MKIWNQWELQQTTFNHSSDMEFQGFMNPYKKCTAKLYSFLVIDTTLPSDNTLCFKKNLIGKLWKLIKTTDDKIRDKKLQYHNNSESANISAFLYNKTDKYEYFLREKILLPEQNRIMEKATFTYSH